MKIKLPFIAGILSVALASGVFAKSENTLEKCGARITASADFPLESAYSETAKINAYDNKRGDGKISKVISAQQFSRNPAEWEKLGFSFTAGGSGEVRVVISAADVKNKDKTPRRLAVYYDDYTVEVNGKTVFKSGFENGLDGLSVPSANAPKVTANPSFVKFGKQALRAWSKSYTGRSIKVEKGDAVAVSVMFRPAGEIAEDDDFFLDLSARASENFSDVKTGADGICAFNGVRFKIPAGSAEKPNSLLLKIGDSSAAAVFSPNSTDASGKYLYMLHYASGIPADSSAQVGTVIANFSDGRVMKKPLYFGKDVLGRDSYKQAMNAKAVFFADEKNRKGAIYFSRVELPSEAPVKSLEFRRASRAPWAIVAATISGKESFPFETWTPAGWTKADIPEDLITVKGSALDFTPFFDDKPAGYYGRAIVSERGTMAFEKSPEKDARFKSFTMSLNKTFKYNESAKRKQYLKEYAELIKRGGYNCVRMAYDQYKSYDVGGDRDDLLDSLDYFFAELKKNGIYMHLTLCWQEIGDKGHRIGLDRDEVKIRCLFGDPTAWEGWKKTTELQLNHFNPYTKLAWKDDPMFVQVEHFNELSIVLSRLDRPKPAVRNWVVSEWRKWLKERYGEIEKLNAEWNKGGFVYNSGTFKYKSFDEIGVPFVKNPDWQTFSLERKQKYLKFCNDVVRATGYKGLIASENIAASPAQNPVRAELFDSIIANTYFSHPSGFNTKDVATKQTSSVGEYFSNLSSVLSRRLNDRPMGITEYNHCFWNKYRYEIMATFPAYAAFQNFSMMTIHENAVGFSGNISSSDFRRMGAFNVFMSPILRASEVVAACVFIRGDIAPSNKRVDMVISDKYLKDNPGEAGKAMNVEQMKVGLICGFATVCERDRPERVKHVKIPPADMKMSPVGSSDTIMEAWFQDVVADENSKGFSLEKFAKKMRENGVISRDNLTNPEKGVFQTDTKQIVFDGQNKSVKISTPKTQLAAMQKGDTADLGELKIISTSADASAGVCSLDGKDIAQSSRLLLIYATCEANDGMETSFDRTYAVTFGHAPILLENGILKADLKLDASKKFSVYPLALNGQRRAKIPAQFNGGVLKLDIDNSKLPDGSTSMFEIVAE